MEKLEVGKWIFLWVVLGEAGSLTLALIMRLMGNLEGRYENMELEEVNRLHDLELQGISHSMTASQKLTNKNEDRLVERDWSSCLVQPGFSVAGTKSRSCLISITSLNLSLML